MGHSVPCGILVTSDIPRLVFIICRDNTEIKQGYNSVIDKWCTADC